ncbi:hypothetical protein MRB53_001726 [Persea americana]|uniref:Uncharacterized protein n=1 Tax=Persea americana TaxID=3435 RepID=A0ACC2MTH4_PERAE|nr:hypothetical protein MRB53_001726 [Persea americana]
MPEKAPQVDVWSVDSVLNSKNLSKGSISTGLRAYPIVGNLPDFIKNRHRILEWLTEIVIEHPTNTVTFRRPGKVQGIITANPMNVEHMLKTNFENYPKGERSTALLHDFLGTGIFNSDGETWKTQNKGLSWKTLCIHRWFHMKGRFLNTRASANT